MSPSLDLKSRNILCKIEEAKLVHIKLTLLCAVTVAASVHCSYTSRAAKNALYATSVGPILVYKEHHLE